MSIEDIKNCECMKWEGKAKYWHRGSRVRWWTHERYKQRKYARTHPDFVFWI